MTRACRDCKHCQPWHRSVVLNGGHSVVCTLELGTLVDVEPDWLCTDWTPRIDLASLIGAHLSNLVRACHHFGNGKDGK